MSLVTVNKSLLITCVQLALSSQRCASQFHFLLIVLMKKTHFYDAFDPLLVERHIGVPPWEPFPTSQTSYSTRKREDEIILEKKLYLTQCLWEFVCHQCLLQSVDPHCLLCRTQRKYPHHSWYPEKRRVNMLTNLQEEILYTWAHRNPSLSPDGRPVHSCFSTILLPGKVEMLERNWL